MNVHYNMDVLLDCIVLLLIIEGCHGDRLSVSGRYFIKDGRRAFLSGTNQAWVQYGYDFGNGQYAHRRREFERSLDQLNQAGGNSMRIWLHIEGQSSPQFTDEGFVIATDEHDTLISDLQTYLRAAAQRNILIFITLWNGAYKGDTHHRLRGLIKNMTKLQSYVDNALIPIVKALKHEPALGGYDIMNEASGIMIPGRRGINECDDTTILSFTGFGWVDNLYTSREIQRFVNIQADGIHRADDKALVTVGTWHAIVNIDALGYHNLYSDECLLTAGGASKGTLDFYQIHAYTWLWHWDSRSPFRRKVSEYQIKEKPIVIGEFYATSEGRMSIEEKYDHAYDNGYAGAWTWSISDGSWESIRRGVASVANYNVQSKGGDVRITV